MKKMRKRLAGILILSFLLAMLGINVMAEEAAGGTQDRTIAYVYVDQATVAIGQTQNVVVAFDNEDAVLKEAVLVGSLPSGENFEIPASNIAGNAALFTQEYTESTQVGAYVLSAVRYCLEDGTQETISFADQQLEAGYTVEAAGENGVNAYALDEAGVVEASQPDAGSVEEAVRSAVENAGQEVSAYSEDDLVVVLCAGHDALHTGATAYGLHEEQLTFKVMQYCKAELEKYAGVIVYTDRPSVACAHPEMSWRDCLHQRMYDAADKGADLLLDLHFNAGGIGASGAEIYYPNTSYSWEIHKTGEDIANRILDKLVALGLHNRGAMVRDCTSGERDENGVLEDYYTTINLSKSLGFPGLIIEHEYIDGPNAGRLYDENFLRQLGVADAQGVVRAYELPTIEESKPPVVESVNITNKDDFNGAFRVEVKIASGTYNVKDIDIPVWTEANGEDDVKSYKAVSAGNGLYYVDVKSSEHNNERGIYHIQTKVTPKYNGSQFVANEQSYTMGQKNASFKTEEAGTFLKYQATVQFDEAPENLQNVMFAVWSDQGGQDDLAWYTGQNAGNNTWTAELNMRNHAPVGTWQIHAYAKLNNGHMILLGTNTVSKPPINLSDLSYSGWYMEYVYEAYVNGWMTGYANGTFGPSDKLSRGQFSTILYRLEGSPSQSFAEHFPDVSDGAFYSVPISWGVEAGVIHGYQNGTFGPNDNISREQLATMFYRLAQAKGMDVSERADLGRFADAEKVSGYAKEAMEWIVAKGIMKGEGDGQVLNPLGNADRAGCATMITRYQHIQ